MALRPDIGGVLVDAFDAVYVINLVYRTDRRADMDVELARIGLSFDHPKLHLFRAMRPEAAAGWPTIGARGCFESHLGVLDQACAAGDRQILVLEDDVRWSEALLVTPAETLAALLAKDWACLYGGPIKATRTDLPPTLRVLPAEEALIGLHCVALRAPFMQAAQPMLHAMCNRPPGHPDGGPMHVDGAYNHVRRAHPDLRAVIADPGLAHQRASRTDVHDLRWFDRLPVLRSGVAALRRWRNQRHG